MPLSIAAITKAIITDATATKMAKKESIETSLHSQLMAKLKDL